VPPPLVDLESTETVKADVVAPVIDRLRALPSAGSMATRSATVAS
jgi:hypothetical protein